MSGEKRFEFSRNTKQVKALGKALLATPDYELTQNEEIIMLPIAEIYEVEGIQHPFEKSLYEGIEELAALIQAAGGIQQPAIVRPRAAGGYEILIGRRRRLAAIMLDMDVIPAVVRNVDDAAAQLIITDNLGQRPRIYPSERAMAYKLEIEALKQQGKSRDFEGTVKELLERHFGQSLPEVVKLEAREIVARIHQIKPRMISYYLRLNNLAEKLLDRVDAGEIPVRAGTELSYLQRSEQNALEEILNEKEIEITIALARELREASQNMERLNKGIIDAIVDPVVSGPERVHSKQGKTTYGIALKKMTQYYKKLPPEKAKKLDSLDAEKLENIFIAAVEKLLEEVSNEPS